MTKLSTLVPILLLLLVVPTFSSALKKRAFHQKSHILTPYSSSKNLIEVKLTKQELPPQQRAEFLAKLTELHKTIRTNKNEKGDIFLQKAKTGTSSIHQLPISNFKNLHYLGDISIGEAGNVFKVVYDTGSSNVWINSDRCNDVGCLNHKQYETKKYPAYKEIGYHLDVAFGTGELLGEINSDDVYIAGVQVQDQKIAEISHQIGDVFVHSGFDGIVGLSYPTMAAEGMQPVFDNIMMQGRLDHNAFSFYFDNGPDGSKESRLILGGADPTYYYEPLMMFPISDQYYWSVKATNILLNGQDVGLCPEGCTLVADTGTTLLTGPSDKIELLLSQISTNQLCSEFPKITFILENGTLDPNDNTQNLKGEFTMEPQDYLLLSVDEATNVESCSPGFMPLDVGKPHGPLWILGDLFLKKYYSVYDRDNNVLGLALAKHA